MDEKHKLSRRGFVGAATGAAAATGLGPFLPAASGHGRHGHHKGDRLLPRKRIGIQLFTVRDQVAALGFEAVFQRLSQIGYAGVEFAGYSAGPPPSRRYSNAELRALLRRYHLKAFGSHVNYYSADPTAYSFVAQLDQVLDGRRGDRHALRRDGEPARSALRRDHRWLPARGRGLQPVRRRGPCARAALLPPPPLGGVQDRGRHAAVRRPARGDRPTARVLPVRDLLGARRPVAVPRRADRTSTRGICPSASPCSTSRTAIDYSGAEPTVVRRPGPTHPGGTSLSEWVMTDVGDGDIAFEPFFCGLDTDDHYYIVERDTAPDPVANPARVLQHGGAQLRVCRRAPRAPPPLGSRAAPPVTGRRSSPCSSRRLWAAAETTPRPSRPPPRPSRPRPRPAAAPTRSSARWRPTPATGRSSSAPGSGCSGSTPGPTSRAGSSASCAPPRAPARCPATSSSATPGPASCSPPATRRARARSPRTWA